MKDELGLMPWPQSVEVHDGTLPLNQTLQFIAATPLSDRVSRILQQFVEQSIPSASLTNSANRNTDEAVVLRISLTPKSNSTLDVLEIDESYSLKIDSNGITLSANHENGLLYGLQTLSQLIYASTQTASSIPFITIQDFPRFKWRGLLLDPARHFLPIEDIKRTLDGMLSAKLNVFHWHLTDDQGWRVESKTYPKLHQLASDGLFYTQEQMREVVEYAKVRGIRVVPEIDIPGHASAIAVAYPELIALPGSYSMQREWGVHRPTLNPIDENVYRFVDTLFGELTSIFIDPYFHIGGDEVNPYQWQNNPKIQMFIEANGLVDYKGMQAYFNTRVQHILAKYNKKMVGWDEIYHPELPENIVIQSWRGHDSINHKSKNKRQSILSTGFYIDQPQPTSYHYRNDPNPRHVEAVAYPTAQEQWKSWRFTIARVKGSPITGTVTLIQSQNNVYRGFIDFSGRSRRNLEIIEATSRGVQFFLDTWMGEFRTRIPFNSDTIVSTARVANAQYQFEGELIAGSEHQNNTLPKGDYLPPLTTDEQLMILGGEATLWGELVQSEILDIRLWPRTYAIAERLWSDRDIRDKDSMYSRMYSVSKWAEQIIGLQHVIQSEQKLRELAHNNGVESIRILAEALEQAQYYHRHHARYKQEEYYQNSPLNRLVDALPPESHATRQLEIWVQQWLEESENEQAKQEITAVLSRWEINAGNMLNPISSSEELEHLRPVIANVQTLAQAGLMVVSALTDNSPLSETQIIAIQSAIARAKEIQQEMVISSAYPIEKLLFSAIDKQDKF